MKRITLKLQNNDQNINIPINGINNLLGYDDAITSLVSDETDTSINDSVDGEVRRILPSFSRTFNFQFWNGSTYVSQVAPLEFSSSEFSGQTARSSFYIIQVFDSAKEEIQNKKHTGYYNGYDFAKTNLVSSYSYNENIEFSNLYLPQSFLDSKTGNTIVAYIKFLFYSAKSGKFYLFYNNNDPSLTTQDKLYYQISIDKSTFKYTLNPSYGASTITPRELRNTTYTNFINQTVSSFPVAKPTYPNGNTFTNDGNYTTQ